MRLALLVLLLAVQDLSTRFAPSRQDSITEEQAKSVCSTELKRVEWTLSESARERFKKATGVDAPARVVVYEGRANITGDGEMHVVVFAIPIAWGKEKATLGVAVAPGARMIGRAKLLDRDPVEFTKQFFGYPYDEASVERPRGDLDALLKKDDKQVRAMLAVKKAMREMVVLDEALAAKMDAGKATVDDVKAITQLFIDAEKAAPDAAFLGGRTKDFGERLAAARVMLETLEKNIKTAKAKDAAAAFRGSCQGCHGGYLGAFRRARGDAGLGNGYFRSDFDLKGDPKLDDAAEEAIAKAVRAAALLAGSK